MEHRIEEIGDPQKPYVTRYRLDLETRAVAAFLYSEGVVANDRTCTFINSLSGDALGICAGSIYSFCSGFADACAGVRPVIENAILNSGEACTDATVMTTDGAQAYIRNFSTNVVLGPVLLPIDLVTGNFTKLREDALAIWTNIQQAASMVWSGIRQAVGSLAQGLVGHVVILFTGLKNTLGSLWSAMKNMASSAWNALKDLVISVAGNLKQAAVSAFQNMASGIRSALSALGGAVSDVADKIRSFLHFSVPDEGPLTDYESWMPDFMGGLARGIEKSRELVEKAVRGVASDMVISPRTGAAGLVKDTSYKGLWKVSFTLREF